MGLAPWISYLAAKMCSVCASGGNYGALARNLPSTGAFSAITPPLTGSTRQASWMGAAPPIARQSPGEAAGAPAAAGELRRGLDPAAHRSAGAPLSLPAAERDRSLRSGLPVLHA